METKTPTLQSPFQINKAKRDKAIYEEYCRLITQPGSSKLAVINYLLAKHNLCSHSSIYQIIHEQENRIQK